MSVGKVHLEKKKNPNENKDCIVKYAGTIVSFFFFLIMFSLRYEREIIQPPGFCEIRLLNYLTKTVKEVLFI